MATAAKMTHEQILALVSARNKYSGHTAKEDSKRLKVLVGQKDADIVKALNEMLVEDFNSGFEGKGVASAPKELIIYMTDVLGLGAEEEEEVEIEEESDDEVVLEEEDEEEVTVEDDAPGDDDFNLDELDGDDAVETEDEEATEVEEEGDEPNLDDDFDMGDVEDEIEEATKTDVAGQTNGKHTEAPKVAAKKQQVAQVQSDSAASEIERALLTMLGALAEGHEIVIYKRPSAASVSAEVNSKKKVTKDETPAEDKEEKKKAVAPKKAATPAEEEVEAPSGPAKATKKSIETFVAGAYANTRKIVNEKFTNVKTKRIVCEALGIKPKSSRKKMADYTDRALMNLLLTHVKSEAAKFAKATPDKAQTRADGATWAMTLLKTAASKAKAASTAAKK